MLLDFTYSFNVDRPDAYETRRLTLHATDRPYARFDYISAIQSTRQLWFWLFSGMFWSQPWLWWQVSGLSFLLRYP